MNQSVNTKCAKMRVGDIHIPERTLTNTNLSQYAQTLGIPHFKGVFMRDQLPNTPSHTECGIMNFNTSKQTGTHWVTWVKQGNEKIYFDSFAQHTPMELIKYLKTPTQWKKDIPCIRRNIVVVQHINTTECGALCLYVLHSLMCEHLSFEQVIEHLQRRYAG